MLNMNQIESIKEMRNAKLAYFKAETEGNTEAMEIARQKVIELRKNGFQTTRGEWAAINAYTKDVRAEGGAIIVSDFGFDHDADDLLTVFEQLGIDEFIVTDSSTALMGWLINVMARGWNIAGAVTIPAENEFEDEKKGLRIKHLTDRAA